MKNTEKYGKEGKRTRRQEKTGKRKIRIKTGKRKIRIETEKDKNKAKIEQKDGKTEKT